MMSEGFGRLRAATPRVILSEAGTGALRLWRHDGKSRPGNVKGLAGGGHISTLTGPFWRPSRLTSTTSTGCCRPLPTPMAVATALSMIARAYVLSVTDLIGKGGRDPHL
jgi:hypothetical protein